MDGSSKRPPPTSSPTSPKPRKQIGLIAAAAMGVGGMMGAGLYTLLGLAATTAGAWLPLAFVLGGVAALCSVYSYSKLGATFPSRGGAAQFLVEEMGDSTVSGGLNVFQYVSYLIATSLYAAGFAEYFGALVGDALPSWSGKAAGVGSVIVFALVNMVGSRFVGTSETVIVGVETAILLGFIVLGLFKADPSRLESAAAASPIGVITAAALLYVTYQGFGVVTNASAEMARPRKELPRALFLAIGVVATLYVVISTLVVMLVPLSQIEADAGHVLADAGQAVAGRLGFVVIAVAALLATASAVNATLFASSNVAFDVAQNRQLPRAMTKTVWRDAPMALIVSAAIVVALVLAFPLSAVGQMTSLAFLILYGAVSGAHMRVRQRTGARACLLVVAVIVNAALFVALLANAIGGGAPAIWITLLSALIGSFVFEWLFRVREGRDSRRAA